MKLTIPAPAKINLYLDITGIRDDGYHNIKSIMQTVSLYDIITVETEDAADTAEITLSCDNPNVPTGEKNIAYKAAMSFFRHLEITGYRCRIHIEKHIPMEAGLAGGSTDAATVLKALNTAYGNRLTVDELCSLGASLGADVPFCIVGGTMLCEGIGEMLSPLPSMPLCYIALARGGEGVSTPAAYRLTDEIHGSDYAVSGGNFAALSDALESADLSGLASSMYNIFEDVILPNHSTASRLLGIMAKHGAVGTMMSGSGPSVFGIFDSKESAESAVAEASEIASAFVCSPVNL